MTQPRNLKRKDAHKTAVKRGALVGTAHSFSRCELRSILAGRISAEAVVLEPRAIFSGGKSKNARHEQNAQSSLAFGVDATKRQGSLMDPRRRVQGWTILEGSRQIRGSSAYIDLRVFNINRAKAADNRKKRATAVVMTHIVLLL